MSLFTADDLKNFLKKKKENVRTSKQDLIPSAHNTLMEDYFIPINSSLLDASSIAYLRFNASEMVLSCTARALKFSLFIFNLVFLFCGLVCVGIGTWLVLDKYAIDNLAMATAQIQGYEQDAGLRDLATKPTAVRQIGYLLLVGGLLVIFVAFLGCCGAAKEWRPLLCCYATCLMVILATEIAAAIYAAMHSHMFENDFREILRASLRLYNGTDNHRKKAQDGMLMKAAWDKLMLEKGCCGVDSKIGEFSESGWYLLTKGRHPFPPACCPPDANGKLRPVCHLTSRHVDGCYAKIAESFQELTSHFKIVSWTVVLIALIQVVTSKLMYIVLSIRCSVSLWASGFAIRSPLRTSSSSLAYLGCIVHMFHLNQQQFSATIGVIVVLLGLQVVGCALALSFCRLIRTELLRYY